MRRSARCYSALAVVIAGGLALTACGVPAPPVPAVDLGQAAHTSAASPTVPGASPTAPGSVPLGPGTVPGGPMRSEQPTAPLPTLDGRYTVVAGEAATVGFSIAAGVIEVLEIRTAPGWQQVEDDRGLRDVEMTWVGGPVVVTLDTEIDDGRFESKVDIDVPAAAGQYTYQVGEAGAVTIDVAGDRVALVGQETAPGWVATVDERELADGEVEIRYRADGAATTIDFDAEVEDAVLNIDIDTQTGRDYTAPPVS